VKRYLARLVLPFALMGLLLAHIAGYLTVPYIGDFEKQLYDTRVRLAAPRGVDSRIVIAAVDEVSLEKEGHFPWTRDKLALLVDQLFQYGAAVVGFDMVFAERDESADVRLLRALADSPGDTMFLERLAQLEPNLDRDRIFAESLGHGPTVLGYYFDTNREMVLKTGVLPYPAFELSDSMAGLIRVPAAFGYGANLEELVTSAYSAGFISNPLIDRDGIVRRAPLLHKHELGVYESLSLAIAAVYFNDITLPIFVDAPLIMEDYPPLEALELAGDRIPIDAQGAVLIPYRGPAGSFPYISATRIMSGSVVNADLLKDAIVLVGATAPGLGDIRSTPFGSVYPGVEIHANVVAGMLDKNFRWQPAYTVAAEMVSVAVFGLMSAFILPLLSPIRSTIQTILIFGTAMLLNFYLWEVKLHVLPLANTLITIFGIYVFNMVFGYFFETRSRSHMNDLFGQYVPPDLVKEMSEDPQNYSLASEKRELTVLFSDIRGFTSISERLDAEELSEMMNAYLTPMTRIIHEWHGTIDKYIGDAIMAFWGAPVKDPVHASQAINAGLTMLKELDRLNETFEQQGVPKIQIGVGINTGVMSVGNMGSRFRRAYTVLGDAVNLGSRLEGLTKVYGVWLIVGEDTRAQAPEFTYRELDRVRVKGKLEPVTIYEVVGLSGQLSHEKLAMVQKFDEMLEKYRSRNWAAAEAALSALKEDHSNFLLCDLYLERIRNFRDQPPGPDWDGVFSHSRK
jgi:adenylate cyclase